MATISFVLDLTTEEKDQLRSIIGGANDAELTARLAKVARAGVQEHLDLYLGTGVFSRGADFKEHRLAMLSLYLFDGTIPDEGLVARMFQMTRTGSRSLLRAMLSKYQLRLAAPLRKTLQVLLSAATPRGEDRHSFACSSPALVQELNDRLKEMKDPYSPIALLPEEAGRYVVDNATLTALKTAHGL